MAKKEKKHAKKVAEEREALSALRQRVDSFELDGLKTIKKFEELPLSEPTQKGLKASHFVNLTEIQRESIIYALQGVDILGAARTGSGKTLAFLVPLLEKLFQEQWSAMDGLGALVITPTRELALQIFEVLRKIGKFHSFSAGLLIGGKDLHSEKDRVSKLNIMICTPGRLLQHMDESFGFDATNLQYLVLDEADRILDMGFKRSVDAILQNLSPDRQTLLFSATQTRSINDLARLSLDSPKYISVGDVTVSSTPKELEQYYTVGELGSKLDNLWSFIKSHTKNKLLVFISSSKQVRFVYESFRRLQPGVPLLHLHGRQKQTARLEVTEKFSRSRASCLFATDVVARGIDFPEVDWVIQLDCPEDAATYIHRVGRSARAGKSGRALLFLTPREEPFVANLEARKVPISKLTIKEAKKHTIQPDLQAQLFQDPELKYLAQKAFISYVRSIYLQKDKTVFDVESLPLDSFAKSLGLANAPNVKVKGNGAGTRSEAKNQPRALNERDADKPERTRTKYDRMFERQNQNVLSEHYQKLSAAAEENSDDELMTIKRQGHDIDESQVPEITQAPESKRSAKRALSKKQVAKTGSTPSKVLFDDEGKPHALYEFEDEEDFKMAGDARDQQAKFISEETEEFVSRDLDDKALAKEKRQEKKRRRKELERLAREAELDGSDEEVVARLPSDSEPEEPARAKDRRQAKRQRKNSDVDVLEVDEPVTLEDLESLSSKLLRG